MDNKPIIFPGVESKTQLLAFLSLKTNIPDIEQICLAQDRYQQSVIFTGGKAREVHIPTKQLNAVLRICLSELEKVYFPSDSATAYIKGRGIIKNAQPHVGKRWLLKIDLENFYGSITSNRVKGLLRKLAPDRSQEFYDLLTDIVTFNSALPTGSPTSPIISNIIMTGFDSHMEEISKKYDLSYTRYSDDITLSSNNNVFPLKLAYTTFQSDKKHTFLGPVLDKLIKFHGFKANPRKISLVGQNSRMKVTGLIVNHKLNIPSSEFKKIRAIIRFIDSRKNKNTAFTEASECYSSMVGWANGNLDEVSFKAWLRGKIYYIRYIKGDFDPKYIKIARKYKSLDSDFKFRETPSLDRLKVYLRVEGMTDYKHITSSLEYLKRTGEFLDLHLNIVKPTANSRGSAQLLSDYHTGHKSTVDVNEMHVYLFDRDEEAIVNKFGTKDVLSSSKNTFAIMLPKPVHHNTAFYSIEHYYAMEDIKSCTLDGRRLYLRSEFDSEGWNDDKSLVYTLQAMKEAVVASSKVFNVYTKNDVSLSKDSFAEEMQKKISGGEIDLSSFKQLFAKICDLREKFYKDVILPTTIEKRAAGKSI